MDIVAHRGASHDAPENTLAAVRLALAQDADAVEVDVRLSADQRLIVIHDPDTRRIAGGLGKAIAELAGEDLDSLDAGRWKGDAFAGEHIPVLAQVLEALPAGRRIYVEMKVGGGAIGELVRTLTRSRLIPSQIVVIAFDLEIVSRVKHLLPQVEVGWLLDHLAQPGVESRESITSQACAARQDGLNIAQQWIDADWRQRTRAAGLKLHAWTVDDPARARELHQLGVDSLTTNRPGWMRQQLGL